LSTAQRGRRHRAAKHAVRDLPALAAVAALLLGAGLALLRGSDPASAAPSAGRQPEPGVVPGELGPFLYGRDCAGCHGDDGEGSPRGIALIGAGEAAAHYALVTGRMPLREPDEEPRRAPPRYTDEEIDALVDHVARFGDGPPLPDVDWRRGDVPNGGELYRLHCGACHSATGIGGALVYSQRAPSLMPAEPSVVAAAVVSGPGAMPSFGPQGFTDDELADLVSYVQEIRTPVDRGGWPLFRAGRVDEGLFAWLLAVPAALLAAAWVARRSR
jgi:ubiquinol-cytochrome c reductase cytochrome c subunit